MLESGDWSLWVSSVLFTAHRSGTEVTIVILPEIHCWTSLPQIAKGKNRMEQTKWKLYLLDLSTHYCQYLQCYKLELLFWRLISLD